MAIFDAPPEITLQVLFPTEVRKAKIKSYVKWGAINFFMVLFLTVFIAYYWDNWIWSDSNCIANLSWWVCIYLVIHMLHISRKIAIIVIWSKAQDPTIA